MKAQVKGVPRRLWLTLATLEKEDGGWEAKEVTDGREGCASGGDKGDGSLRCGCFCGTKIVLRIASKRLLLHAKTTVRRTTLPKLCHL